MAVSDQWLVLELHESQCLASFKDIESAIKVVFGSDADYFIPIHYEIMGSYVSTSVLVEGYVFVRDAESTRRNLSNLYDQRILAKVLTIGGKYRTINSRLIAGMKNKLRNSLKKIYGIGAQVKILEGVFKNLVGTVVGIEENGRHIMVKITRISREMVVPVPSTLLQKYNSEQKD